MKIFGAALAAAAIFGNIALADVDPIVIKGSKFFYQTNGTQFFIKGVAYQQDYAPNGGSTSNTTSTSTYTDPISDDSSCLRDIPYLQQLGTNAIRVYAIDPTKGHDKCMNALADAGIYVIADLSAPGQSIIRSSPSWNDDLYTRYTQVIDSMAQYTNTLGFFAGNEVTNNDTNTDASAFVKAAVRDMKTYIKQKNYRTIGVGYATSDDAGIRQLVAEYFDCGDRSQAVDFWGYNIYSWCGDSSYSESGYDQRTAEFANYDVPVFFAEYGCNEVQPRTFTEVQALYGDQMTPVWSGGIVYMYFEETNHYGLVSVSGDSVSTLVDFENLSSQIAAATPSGVNSASYTPTNTAAAQCPSIASTWAASNTLPPTPNRELCQCMYSALTCAPNRITDEEAGALFGTVCGLGQRSGVCAGITNNATTGSYGAYGMCNSTEQLGWALNAYYLAQTGSNRASACDFSGSATTKSPASATGSCSALIAQAGPQGTGTVTSAPSGTGSAGGSGSSGSAGSSGSGNAAPRFGSTAVFGTGIAISAYISLAFVSGMAMIFL